MSRAHLTALATALALGAFAPRLAAQDTSSAGLAQPDTAGYTGAGGVDTSASRGRFGDSTGAATDTIRLGGDSTSDTTGMSGRHPERTKPGSTESPRGSISDSGAV